MIPRVKLNLAIVLLKKKLTFMAQGIVHSHFSFLKNQSLNQILLLAKIRLRHNIPSQRHYSSILIIIISVKKLLFFNVALSVNSHATKYTDVEYSGCDINNLSHDEDEYSSIYYLGCYFNLTRYQVPGSISKGIDFELCSLPDTIDFLPYNRIKGEIFIDPSNDGKIVKLLIGKYFPIQNLKVKFSSFELIFDVRLDAAEIESIYRKLIEKQKELGSQKDIESAEIALKDYLAKQGDVFLVFQKFLWNYGYDKTLLLKRLLFFYILFYFMNLSLISKLIHEVYPINNLMLEYDSLSHYRNRKIKYLRFPFVVFLYSSIIFFGWKMDFDKFKFKHLLLSLYVIAFYLIGLGLLFYAIGLLLNKG